MPTYKNNSTSDISYLGEVYAVGRTYELDFFLPEIGMQLIDERPSVAQHILFVGTIDNTTETIALHEYGDIPVNVSLRGTGQVFFNDDTFGITLDANNNLYVIRSNCLYLDKIKTTGTVEVVVERVIR